MSLQNKMITRNLGQGYVVGEREIAYSRRELSKMFGLRSTVLPALELIMKDPEEYHRRREAAIKLGLVGC